MKSRSSREASAAGRSGWKSSEVTEARRASSTERQWVVREQPELGELEYRSMQHPSARVEQ